MNMLFPEPDSLYFHLPDGSMSAPIARSQFKESELVHIDSELERIRRRYEGQVQAHTERLIFLMETDYGHKDARSIIVDNPIFDHWLDTNPGYEQLFDSEDMKDVHIVLARFKEYLAAREEWLQKADKMVSLLRSEYGHDDVEPIIRSQHFWGWVDSQTPEIAALGDSEDLNDVDMILNMYKRVHPNYIELIEVDTPIK